MSNNDLEEDGARSFVEFLERTKTLKVLKVNNCQLGNQSAALMLKAIEKNKNL